MPVDMKSWGERLIEQGALRARREVVALLLRERFGNVPADLEEQLADLDGATLDTLLVRIIHVASADEFLAGVLGSSSRRDASREGKPRVDTAGATQLVVQAIEQDTPWGRMLVEASIRREKRQALIRQMETRFATVPTDLHARLAYRNRPFIDALAEHLAQVTTLEQFMTRVPVKVLSTKDGGITMGELEQRLAEDSIAFCTGNAAVEEAIAGYRLSTVPDHA